MVEEWLKSHWKFIQLIFLVGGIIVAILTIGITFNQTVQPLFKPTISSFETFPLYITSQTDGQNIAYYNVFKTKYDIEPALYPSFPRLGQKEIKIKIPENTEFISQFEVLDPYVKLNIPSEYTAKNFLSSHELQKISILLEVDGREIKSIPLELYFREGTGIKETSPDFGTDYYWWSFEKIKPDERPTIVASWRKLGYGIRGEKYYSFNELILENRMSLDIKGYYVELGESGKNFDKVCRNFDEVNTAHISGNEHLFLDLNSGESKRYIVIKGESKESVHKYLPLYNIGSLHCYGTWNRYFDSQDR